ncbi:proteoglycan 3 isoform X2 [Equus caballus]|uniref:proteoglycan 3 isoform X2 n=1 Tax=Equus caballus TaxID=9796 RepID=UPI0038B2C703
MKCPLVLPFLLLGTVAALHLENHDPHLDIQETQADLIQYVEGSGEQEGELAVTDEVLQSEGEEAEASTNQDTFEDEEAMESDQAALGEGLQCPREEETIELSGHPGCKTCRYFLVRTPRTFRKAENVCERCYRGNLVSIHNPSLNYRLQCLIRGINQAQVWIGGILKVWGVTGDEFLAAGIYPSSAPPKPLAQRPCLEASSLHSFWSAPLTLGSSPCPSWK